MSGFLVQPRGPRGPKSKTEALNRNFCPSNLIRWKAPNFPENAMVQTRSLTRSVHNSNPNKFPVEYPTIAAAVSWKRKKVSIQLKIKGSKRNPILLGWWDVVTSSGGSLLHALYISFSSIAAIQNHLWYMLSHSLMRLSSIHGFLCHNNSDSGYRQWT